MSNAVDVWAYHKVVPRYIENYKSGWGFTFKFGNLSDLNRQLANAKLNNRVQRIAVVAHGLENQAGLRFDRPLTAKSAANDFLPELLELGQYLTSAASVILFGCSVANFYESDGLLIELSTILHGRYIIHSTLH